MDDPAARSPPPTPPRVVFDPPLFFQRRTAVVDILSLLHKHPRFNGKLKSLIDVGCGTECLLLQKLVSPNDDLPLDQVTGIDMDPMLWNRDMVNAFDPVNMTDEGERWRKFGLTLLSGSFEHLSLGTVAHHDIVTSCEVIEHLDPGPLANFAKVLLGNLKPKICIITTPNREFNDIFTLPFTPLSGTPLEEIETLEPSSNPKLITPITADGRKMITVPEQCTSDSRYWREGVPYGMRHPDHRFEWTRQEFRGWAKEAAERYGYTVCFTGVGGFRNGMCVINSSGAAVRNALRGGFGPSGPDNREVTEEALEKAFESEDEGIMEKASRMWGDCTQIAIFIVKEEDEENHEELVKLYDWSKNHTSNPEGTGPTSPSFSICPLNPWLVPNPIGLVCHYDYPYVKEEVFPPSFLTLMEMLEPELVNFLPGRMLEEWQKTPQQMVKDAQLRRQAKLTGQNFSHLYCQDLGDGSDSECDYGWDPEVDGDEAVRKGRKRERKVEKRKKKEIEEQILGGKRADLIRVVKVMGVPLKALWESSNWKLKRACRHRFEVFKEVLMSVIDEVGTASISRSRNNSVSERSSGNNRAGCYCGKTRYYKVIINTTGVPLRDENEDGYSSPYGICPSCQTPKSGTPSPATTRRRMSISDAVDDVADSPALSFPLSPKPCRSSECLRSSTQIGSSERLEGIVDSFLPKKSNNVLDSLSPSSINNTLLNSTSESVETTFQKGPSTLRRSRSATVSTDPDSNFALKRSSLERSNSNSCAFTALNHNDEKPTRSGLVRFAGMAEVWHDNGPITPPRTSHKKAKSLSFPTLVSSGLSQGEGEHVFLRPFSPPGRISTPRHYDNCKLGPEPLTPESSLDMFVKLYSVAATRSVIDLIRSGLTEHDKQVLRRWKVVRVEMNPFVGEEGVQEELSIDNDLTTFDSKIGGIEEEISRWSELLASSTDGMNPSHDVSPLAPLDGTNWDYFGLPSSSETQESLPRISEQQVSTTATIGNDETSIHEPEGSWGFQQPSSVDDSSSTVTAAKDSGDIADQGELRSQNNNDMEGNHDCDGQDSDDAKSDYSQYSLTSGADEYSNHREFSSFSYYSPYDEGSDYYGTAFIAKRYRMELIYGLENFDSTLSIDSPLNSWEVKGKWKSIPDANLPWESEKNKAQIQNNKDVNRFMILFSSSGVGLDPSCASTSVHSALGQAGIPSPRIITVSWPAYQSALQRVTRWIEKRREMQRERNLYLNKKILVRKIDWDEWCKQMEQEELEDEREKFGELSRRKFKLRIEGQEEDILWKEEAMQAAGWSDNGMDDGGNTEVGVVVYKPKERWVWEGSEDGSEGPENEQQKKKAYEEVKLWWVAQSSEDSGEKEMGTEILQQKQRKDSVWELGPGSNQSSRNLAISGSTISGSTISGSTGVGVGGLGIGMLLGSSPATGSLYGSPLTARDQKLYHRAFEIGDEENTNGINTAEE